MLLIFLAVPLSAQANGKASLSAKQIEVQFASDAEQHQRDLRDLYSRRGLTPPKMRITRLGDIVMFLATKRPDERDESAVYPKGSALLFYAHRGSRLSIYLIGQQGLLAYSQTAHSSEVLRQATTYYRASLKVDGIDESRAPQWRGTMLGGVAGVSTIERPVSGIADILLPEEIRIGLLQVRHLIIVGNGVIATNPFASFPLNEKQVLIDRMSVTVSAGLFDLDQMIRPWGKKREFEDILLVGDPLVPSTGEWKVPRLPGAVTEVNLLASRSGAEALIGKAATKSEVLKRMRRAQMLYFAAHGTSDPNEPLTGGFLMLSGPTPEEAFLTAGEVQRLRLNANLAVLSACQTGLGFNHDGGVIGLARSFQKAGVPRIVMSLWSVSDESAGYMMDGFQLLATTQSPAEALRLAMLRTRARFPDPAHWASFTLFGTPR